MVGVELVGVGPLSLLRQALQAVVVGVAELGQICPWMASVVGVVVGVQAGPGTASRLEGVGLVLACPGRGWVAEVGVLGQACPWQAFVAEGGAGGAGLPRAGAGGGGGGGGAGFPLAGMGGGGEAGGAVPPLAGVGGGGGGAGAALPCARGAGVDCPSGAACWPKEDAAELVPVGLVAPLLDRSMLSWPCACSFLSNGLPASLGESVALPGPLAADPMPKLAPLTMGALPCDDSAGVGLGVGAAVAVGAGVGAGLDGAGLSTMLVQSSVTTWAPAAEAACSSFAAAVTPISMALMASPMSPCHPASRSGETRRWNLV